jgi:hypothetical protein
MARATPQYTKRAKYNLIVCDSGGTPTGGAWESGAYFKIDQFYSEVFISDVSNIFYNPDGTQKVIAYDTLANITNYQLIVSEDKQSIYFYGTPLDIESKCFENALKQAKLIEQLQSTEEGGVENVYTTESTGIELAYCYKDFVEVKQ